MIIDLNNCIHCGSKNTKDKHCKDCNKSWEVVYVDEKVKLKLDTN
jgi:hypothetical protein